MSNNNPHEKIERNVGLMAVLVAVVVSFGGLAEIVPLMYQAEAIEPLPGVEPYDALALAGRDVYIREGCYGCHSQMVRTLRFETERYGHYSLAGESVYDRPFQWGSKRTGPDLARVGGRYSDEWHQDHFRNPQSVVPESIMPKYAFLFRTRIDGQYIGDSLKAHAVLGVPYSDEMIANATADFLAQVNPDGDFEGLEARYGTGVTGRPVNVRNFDGQPEVTEADALIAYLQVLGTMVDFSTFTPDPLR